MREFRNELKTLKNKYPGYLIINVLYNDEFEAFDEDINKIAKFIGFHVDKKIRHYIFKNYTKIISKFNQLKKYNVIAMHKGEIVAKIKKKKPNPNKKKTIRISASSHNYSIYCNKCKYVTNYFKRFNSGKCFCVKCLNEFSKEDLIKLSQEPFKEGNEKRYYIGRYIRFVQGGQP